VFKTAPSVFTDWPILGMEQNFIVIDLYACKPKDVSDRFHKSE
jgi:hypothetical protein